MSQRELHIQSPKPIYLRSSLQSSEEMQTHGGDFDESVTLDIEPEKLDTVLQKLKVTDAKSNPNSAA